MGAADIASVQQLRGIAALGVVVYHALSQAYGTAAPQAYVKMGAAGVDLFFVISGFIMWVTAVDRDQSPARFVAKRLIRIVPLYWLITSVVLAVVLLAPALMRSAQFDAAHILASYAFVAWPHPKFDRRFWPLLVPGWTLNYEMAFYAIVAVSLAATRRLRPWIIGGSLGALVLVGQLQRPPSLLAFYTDPILLEFGMGAALGALYTTDVRLRASSAVGLIVFALLLFLLLGPHSTDTNRVVTWGVPMAISMCGAVQLPMLVPEKTGGRLLLSLGDASYSIYLTQFCTVAPSARLLVSFATTPGSRMALGAALIAVATLVGIATYHTVERPLTRLLRRKLERSALTLSSPSSGPAGHLLPQPGEGNVVQLEVAVPGQVASEAAGRVGKS